MDAIRAGVQSLEARRSTEPSTEPNGRNGSGATERAGAWDSPARSSSRGQVGLSPGFGQAGRSGRGVQHAKKEAECEQDDHGHRRARRRLHVWFFFVDATRGAAAHEHVAMHDSVFTSFTLDSRPSPLLLILGISQEPRRNIP